MSTVYLSLGTNLGERRRNLEQAVVGVQQWMAITAVSCLYETKPWGLTDQPDFLNMCLAAATDVSPHDLLDFCKQLEDQIGREKTVRWGPRLLDLDILVYDDLILDDERLTIPHPHIEERAFVLTPLAEIAPALIHPVSGQTVATLAEQVDAGGVEPLPPASMPPTLYELHKKLSVS